MILTPNDHDNRAAVARTLRNAEPFAVRLIYWLCGLLRKGANMFEKYRRTNIAEMRPYVPGEDLTNISVSNVDDPETDLGMVARNPMNHNDQWYVARQYFEDNFEPV